MRRPCVIPKVNGGKPFCAYMSFVELDHNGEFWEVLIEIESSSYRYVYAIADTEKEANAIVRILEWQLAKALNPLIEVTKKVRDAMDKVPEAKFRVQNAVDEHLTKCYYDTHWGQQLDRVNRKYVPRGAWIYDKVESTGGGETIYSVYTAELELGDYIQADCPLALQVLLQFNTEGELFNV